MPVCICVSLSLLVSVLISVRLLAPPLAPYFCYYCFFPAISAFCCLCASQVRDENAEIFATVSAQEYAELKQQRRAENWIEGDFSETTAVPSVYFCFSAIYFPLSGCQFICLISVDARICRPGLCLSCCHFVDLSSPLLCVSCVPPSTPLKAFSLELPACISLYLPSVAFSRVSTCIPPSPFAPATIPVDGGAAAVCCPRLAPLYMTPCASPQVRDTATMARSGGSPTAVQTGSPRPSVRANGGRPTGRVKKEVHRGPFLGAVRRSPGGVRPQLQQSSGLRVCALCCSTSATWPRRKQETGPPNRQPSRRSNCRL